jgi:hypothetical protein
VPAVDSTEQLWAVEHIKQLKARYFRLMDLKKWEEWADVFTDDCEMRIGSGSALVLFGRGQIVARAAKVMAERVSVHHGHMPEITVLDERTAHGVWSLQACGVPRSETPAASTLQTQTFGHYYDEYVKGADGRWRIARVELLEHLVIVERPASPAWVGGPDMPGVAPP